MGVIGEPILISNSDIGGRLQDGAFVCKGRKKVILGCYHAQPSDYELLKDAGINTVLFKSYDAEEAVGLCDQLESLGMYGIARVGGGVADYGE